MTGHPVVKLDNAELLELLFSQNSRKVISDHAITLEHCIHLALLRLRNLNSTRFNGHLEMETSEISAAHLSQYERKSFLSCIVTENENGF